MKQKTLFGAGWLPRVVKTASKNLKKFLTKANEFDKINELLIERTARNENSEKKLKIQRTKWI